MEEEAAVDRTAEKAAKVREALRHGPVSVRFDPRRTEALVPEGLRRSSSAVLAFSPRFDPPDLVIDEKGLSQTLSFGGKPFACFVPWALVWSVECDVDAGCGFFGEAVPVEQVEGFFNQCMAQRLVIERLGKSLAAGVQLFDTNAGSGAWRRWRDSLREAKPGVAPEAGPRKLELVKGG